MKTKLLNAQPDSFPAEPATFLLSGPAGKLEVITDCPDIPNDNYLAILCHPHPQYEGSMHNKVVTIMERSFRESGFYTVRFNFRGVGNSEGSFDHAVGEIDDLKAVTKWAMACFTKPKLCLGGFSFGSYIAAKATETLPVEFLISIAPPVESFNFNELSRPNCDWLIIQGEEDEIVSPKRVYQWVETVDPPVELIKIEETGHFFHRRLMDLRGLLKNAIKHHLD